MMARILLFCVVSISIFCLISGSCRTLPPENPTQIDCTLGGQTIRNGTEIETSPPSCEKCSCSHGTLSCCGYGNRAGPSHIEGCIRKEVNCDVIFMDAEDPTQICIR